MVLTGLDWANSQALDIVLIGNALPLTHRLHKNTVSISRLLESLAESVPSLKLQSVFFMSQLLLAFVILTLCDPGDGGILNE